MDSTTIRAVYSARALARTLSGASGNIAQALSRARDLADEYLGMMIPHDAAKCADTFSIIAAALAGENHLSEPQPTPHQIAILRDLVRGPPNAFLLVSEKNEAEFRTAHSVEIRDVLLSMNEVGLIVVGQPVKETPAPGAPAGSKQWTAVATPTGRAAMAIYIEVVKRGIVAPASAPTPSGAP